MSLYRRSEEGPWQYLFYVAGKRFRGSTKTTNEKEAEKIEKLAYAAAVRGDSPIPKKTQLLRDFAPRFLKFIDESRLAKQSKRDYRNGWRMIGATKLAAMRMDTITADDVETTPFHKSPYSTNCAIRTLRRMLHKAKDWKEIRECPTLDTVEAVGRNMMFTGEIEMKILARSPQPLNDVAVIVIDSGLRDGEVIKMKVQHLNFEKNYYQNPEGKTERARRRVPLSERVLERLRVRCADRSAGWVFPSGKSKSGHIELHKLQLRFRKICRDLGLPDELKIYCGRHTYGTDVMEDTGNPFLVRDTMGHADLETTNQYMHSNLARAKEAIDRRNAARMPQPVNDMTN